MCYTITDKFQNSIVGAHSLINISVPDNMIAYGVPLRLIKKIDEK